MKKYLSLSILFLLPVLLNASDLPYQTDLYDHLDDRPDIIDPIHDSYIDQGKFSVHSQGLLSYGVHTNTFHIRNAFIRVNMEMSKIQLFMTLNAFKDTHNPYTNYSFMLNNINLYDYGVYYRFTPWFNLGMMGAAVLRKNSHSLLLIPHYYYTDNQGEFDSPKSYLPRFLNAPGLRLNFNYQNWSLSYSQGDWRHSIPMALMLKYNHMDFSIRALAQLENTNPLIYSIDLYKGDYQLSFSLRKQLDSITARSIIEYTFSDITLHHWLRLEQSAEWDNWNLALRFMWRNDIHLLFESSLSYDFLDMAELGLMVSSDGRMYIATRIDF